MGVEFPDHIHIFKKYEIKECLSVFCFVFHLNDIIYFDDILFGISIKV